MARGRGTHARAAAAWGTAGLIGVAVGSAAGGLLTQLISWQAIFAFQVPVVVLVVAAVHAPQVHPEPGRAGRLRLGPEAGLALLSAGLTGVYLAAGGASYEPIEVADPCRPRPLGQLRERSDDTLERIALSTLDGAACRLRVTREELALAGKAARATFAAEHRISEREIDEALRAGLRRAIDDAARLDMVSSFEAPLLRRAVDSLPVGTVLDALRSNSGKSVLGFLNDLLSHHGSSAG